jgi:uncharacterized protein YjiS (DUF1127 family)
LPRIATAVRDLSMTDLIQGEIMMTELVASHSALPNSWVRTAPVQFINRGWKAWIARRIAAATRATLASLDDRILKDLGLRRSDIGLAGGARAVRSLAQFGGAMSESSPTHCKDSIPGDWLTAGKHQ